jgi:monoterpene epsilon-lactone hydrolase
MISHIDFRGPYQLRSAADLTQSVVEVSARRLLKGPRRPSWNWFVEVTTRMLQKQVNSAFEFKNIEDARRYLDSVVISSPALSAVTIREVTHNECKGRWFSKKDAESANTLLYFHGGGYSFYPEAYTNFIAQLACAAQSRTFALDYRLTPEHRFPAQLNDALGAYQWLLKNGTHPEHLVVAGDSAGANLTLALLMAIRDGNLPPPALAVAISPPTDFENERLEDAEFDWINKPALLQWRDWFCDRAQCCNPLISPLKGDLRGLPPIYIQAGAIEILFPSIQAFAEHARSQRADVTLEAWKDMTHNFPVFGPDAPQSAEALKRIAEVISSRVSRSTGQPVAC